jgi:hypothetical protein
MTNQQNPESEPLDALLGAALHPPSDGAAFSQTMFHTLDENMSFDSASLNLCVVDNSQDYRLPELKCYFCRQPQAMATNCQKFCYNDTFSPYLLTHNFKALDGGDYVLLDEWHEYPHYQTHCRFFDVENALAISARFPGHLRHYFMLYFYQATPGLKFSTENREYIEQLFPSLFALWQYRLGFICDGTLKGRLQLLRLFKGNPKLFKLIQLIVRNPMASSKEYARELNISERTVEHQLEKIFVKLKIPGFNKNKKIELFRLFQFLGY